MFDADVAPFVALIRDTYGLYPQSKLPSDGQVAMFFRALAAYPLAVVQRALDGHVKDPQRGRFPPLPADVIAQIEGAAEQDGRPGAEEAWAMSLRARDEAETVVWTREMAEAWGVAKSVFDLGDEVGARMAFKDAYGRLVDVARRQRQPAAWLISEGHDAARRADAIATAVQARRLPASELLTLPAPTAQPLLGLATAKGVPPHIREKLKALSDSMRVSHESPSLDAMAKAKTARLKVELQKKVEAYQREHQFDEFAPLPPPGGAELLKQMQEAA